MVVVVVGGGGGWVVVVVEVDVVGGSGIGKGVMQPFGPSYEGAGHAGAVTVVSPVTNVVAVVSPAGAVADSRPARRQCVRRGARQAGRAKKKNCLDALFPHVDNHPLPVVGIRKIGDITHPQ